MEPCCLCLHFVPQHDLGFSRRNQHPDGRGDGAERALRGGAHQTHGALPVPRELLGARTRRLPAHRQVGRRARAWIPLPSARAVRRVT